MHGAYVLPRVGGIVDPTGSVQRALDALDTAIERRANDDAFDTPRELPVADPQPVHPRVWPGVFALGTLVVAAALLVIASIASGYTVLVPGRVDRAGDLAGSPGAGALLSTSVRIRTASPVELVASWLGVGSVVVERVGPTPSTPEQFHASRRAAWVAAHRCVGARADEVPQAPATDVTGASGGLMMALAHVESLRGRPLSSERIAGTGVIAEDGSLHPVMNVSLKAQAAAASGASVFLVPAPQASEADGVGVRVVGVRTLDDALRAMGAEGCQR